jgi:hypothetical protein
VDPFDKFYGTNYASENDSGEGSLPVVDDGIKPYVPEPAPASTSNTDPPAGSADAPAAAATETETFDDLFADPDKPADQNTTTDTPPPATPPASTEQTPVNAGWSQFVKDLGLPETASYDDVKARQQQLIQQEAQRQLALMEDPVTNQLVDVQGLLSETDSEKFVRACLEYDADKNGWDPDDIDEMMDKYRDRGSMEKRADYLRTKVFGPLESKLKGEIGQREQQQQKAEQQRSEQRLEGQRMIREAASSFRTPDNKGLSPQIQQQLVDDYLFTGGLLNDLQKKLADPQFAFRMAMELHPTLGPRFAKFNEQFAAKKATSDTLKGLEQGTPKIGGAGNLTPAPTIKDVDPDAFYRNRGSN